MARIWVKGYTRSDGSKVEGHYREMTKNPAVGPRRNTPSRRATLRVDKLNKLRYKAKESYARGTGSLSMAVRQRRKFSSYVKATGKRSGSPWL